MNDQMTDYTWGGDRCVREGKLKSHERHPCYFCGTPTDISTATYCDVCGFYQCMNCGKCYCNTKPAEQYALKYLRNKYCCIRSFFENGFLEEDNAYRLHVPHFVDALDYCREREGVDT